MFVQARVLRTDTVDDSAEPVPVVPRFDDFVRDRSQALCRTAFLLTGDAHLAEDLVQVSLAKVVRSWDRIVATGDPMPYVRMCVVRAVVSWRRRRWVGEVPTAAVPERASRDDDT